MVGSQLFQYAAGRRLALARGVPLLIDRSAVDGDLRPYALEPFAIGAQEAPPGARAGFEAHTVTERLIRRMRRRRLVQERSPRFDQWGAWLSNAADQIVVAPDRWFADPARDGRDIAPPAWARVAVDSDAT